MAKKNTLNPDVKKFMKGPMGTIIIIVALFIALFRWIFGG